MAAATALASGVVLAILSLTLARRRVGHVRYLRVFLGPAAGAVAMILTVELLGDSLLVSLPLASVLYALALAAVEVSVWRDDVRLYLEVLPARLRDRLALSR